MRFSLYIAKRYLFSKSSTNAINIMSAIASGGVVIAAAALFIVLSVFAGLKDYSLQFSSFTDPDLKLTPKHGKSFFWTSENEASILKIKGIATHSKIIEERVIVKTKNKNLIATLKGVDANYLNVTQIDSMLTHGNWLSPESNSVVSGWGISNKLSFGVFDYIKPLVLYVPKPGKGQASSIKGYYNTALANNVGLFDINPQLNDQYIFSDLSLARSLLNYNANQISSIELKLSSNANEAEIKTRLENSFPNQFTFKNRVELNATLFKMLNTENLAIYLIFTLVIIIALFNVIGAIIMMILDKKKSLNTLFSLGAETKTIKSIFFLQGSLMTIVSGFVGVFLGLLVVLLQLYLELIPLTPDLPYPVKIKSENILIVLLTIFTLGILASKIAAQRITKQLIQSNS